MTIHENIARVIFGNIYNNTTAARHRDRLPGILRRQRRKEMKMTKTTTTLDRSQYGELVITQTTTCEDRASLTAAYDLVALAAKSGKIPAAFDDMEWGRSGKERGKRIGEARYQEVYDFTSSAVLVCVRSVEGTRYGQKTTEKVYF